MKSSIVSLSTILLVATTTQSVIAAEIQFPQIKTECKTYFQARRPIDLDQYMYNPGDRDSWNKLTDEERRKIKQSLSDLFQSKQWDTALAEIEKISPSRFRDEVSIELVESMSQAKDMDRALQLLLQIFPEKTSHQQAKGIGIVAKYMALNNQFPQALEALNLLSDNDKSYAGAAVVPVIKEILTPAQRTKNNPATPEQLDKIRSIVALFPKASHQETIWRSVGEYVYLVPEVAQQFSGLTSDSNLKQLVLREASQLWFNPNFQPDFSGYYSLNLNDAVRFEYGTEIANSIDNCIVRSRVFLELADRVGRDQDFSRQFTVSAKSRMLDQIESLLGAIDRDAIGDRRIILSQKLALVELNTKFGRNHRSLELLAQLIDEQKQLQFNADRAEILLEIAPYYEKLNRRQTAIQVLEAAEVAIQLAYVKNEDAFSSDRRQGESNVEVWRERTLDSLAYAYRDLKQPKKVAELKRSRCTRLSSEDLSRVRKLIDAGALSASTLRVPGIWCRS